MLRSRAARPPAPASLRPLLAALALAGTACGGAERPAEGFCRALEALGQGEIDVGSDDRNEMVGHVKSLEALIAVAPEAVARDLGFVRDRLAAVRDAGGLLTLLDFAKLQDPELAGAEGRVTRFAAERCGIASGEVDYEVGEPTDASTPCPAWPRAGSPLTNNRFPYLIATAGANYFSATFWSVPFVPAPPGFLDVPRGGSVVFEGEYPFARYFAYHPNDFATNNFDTLTGGELDPDPGSRSPWREDVPPGASRRYTARLVFAAAPAAPEPNTVYVGERARGGGFNPAVFLIYRIYSAEQGSLPPNSAGVPLPAVTIRDADGEVVQRFEACEPYPPGRDAPVDRTRFPAFPVPDHRAVFHPGELRTAPNWGLPVDVLANRDVLYLSTFYGRAQGELIAVRMQRPRTPDPARGIPLWARDADLLLWTVCSYNFWNGFANDCLGDEDVAEEAGRVTIVASDAASRPANATAERGVAWLDTGRFRDGQLTFRMLLADAPLLVELRRAIDTGEVSARAAPFVPEIALCSRAVFESGGFEACRDAWQEARR
ncbi:MAG TPA: hypothetical protein VFC77_10590 [Myxococcota bacterium]|nr:hypothetical protein [Myxococcota bacterium]